MPDGTISMLAAERIWRAHREIEAGEKLLAEIKTALTQGRDATPLDPHGRRRGFSLGVPMGNNGERLLEVSPRLASYVIEAHIAEKRRELVEVSIAARLELEGAPSDA